jgi:hypothetical protein
MKIKTLIESEEQYYKLFFTQFNVQEHAQLAWTIIDKPESYPCVVIKSCGKYIYVYPEDFPTAN